MIGDLTAVIAREAALLLALPGPLGETDLAKLEALCRAARALKGVGFAPKAEAPPAGDVASLEADADAG